MLGLVKAIQASLTIFGMFDLNYERNGLLCDLTVDGIQKWVVEIGEPHIHVEVGALALWPSMLLTQPQPMERVADPTIVSALLSLVFTMRNKLHDLGQVTCPSPQFSKTLITYSSSLAIRSSNLEDSSILSQYSITPHGTTVTPYPNRPRISR